MDNINDLEREGWDSEWNRLIDILETEIDIAGNLNDLERNSRSTSNGAIKVIII